MQADASVADYIPFLRRLQGTIGAAQLRAALTVNREVILLYWQLGRAIVEQQERLAWGEVALDRLGRDVQRAFPGVGGLSGRNLARMRAFFLAYRDEPEFVPQVAAQLPWSHNVLLIERIADRALRAWYARAAIHHGWSRAILAAQIDAQLHARQGRSPATFAHTAPAPQSELARQLLKDPDTFDFLTLQADVAEREAERDIAAHLRDFLLALGLGFALVGSHYPLAIGGEDRYVDLLFYHLRLRRYVVIAVRARAVQPADAAALNLSRAAVDGLLRHPDDAPSIGMVIGRDANGVQIAYALRDLAQSPEAAGEALTQALPGSLAMAWPTIAQLEAELANHAPEATAARDEGGAR